MQQSKQHNLRIDIDRLWESLMDMARIGGLAGGGCNRQALTHEDAEGRALFKSWCEAADLDVTVDRLGSMFARRAGTEDLPPVLIGSHLDTQPTGGKFDGVLGVLAGLEVLRCLNEAGVKLRRPIEIVNWTNEEGCRFAPAMLASAVFSGVADERTALATRDAKGITLGEEVARMGLEAVRPVGEREIDAYLELHIEQGPILEASGSAIGFVVGGQGILWYDLTITGFERHSGSTPMSLRKDALVAAAHVIGKVQAIAHAFAPDAVATVGQLDVLPNSRNVIPGEVRLTIDLRHPRLEALKAMDDRLHHIVSDLLVDSGVSGILTKAYEGAPVSFDAGILDVIRRETAALGFVGQDIVSGAGHDAFNLARIAPTAMIFTPCRDGISHNEAEDMTREWAQAGTDVLMRTVIELANRP